MKRARKPRKPQRRGHANEAVHEAIMKRLAAMTPEEIFQTMVDSGIYTRRGKLRKPYAPQPDDPQPA